MSGYYIIPIPESYLNLTGGTVSGETIFEQNLSASTLYITSALTENNQLNQLLVYNPVTYQIEYKNVSAVTNFNTLDVIEYDDETLTISTKYNTEVDDSVFSVQVGGAPPLPASDWKNKNLVDVLDTILFPTLSPTYIIPTLTLSSSITGVREIGSSINPTLTIVGTKNNAGPFTQLSLKRTFNSNTTTLGTFNSPAVGAGSFLPAQYGYQDPNNPNLTYTSSFTDSWTIPPPPSSYFSMTQYGGNSIYLSGLTKLNNKGNNDTNPYQVRLTTNPQDGSNTLAPTPINIMGIYPYFFGTGTTQPTVDSIADAISGGTANKVLADAQGTLNIIFNADNVFLWFAHNASNATKTRWFETVNNSGNIGSSTDLFDAPITHNVSSSLGYWNNIPFKLYISNYPTSTIVPPRDREVTEMRNN